MDTFFIILHIALCFTLLPMRMKGWGKVIKVIAVVISLSVTPLAMIIGPLAAFIGYVVIWLLSKLIGLPTDI